ncbi:hypothetical protein EV649_5897 [Kribbella sp. VKM Ac-2569]|uniref:hypothetical protein n=1 Tax=Kribbella sp. VKM Ac-2569 TaxID=2512220 RepID=UPI0010DED472|nr:hypothetical protein [Kribbella sp. VKM Ac-2569]RZT15113.1 hypothetical protein EV649_5897 [Kribbella sp. VKM Ac-2569]
MRTVMTGPAWVAYSQIYVESAEDYADMHECFAGQRNGLCGAAVAGKLFLMTGLHTGKVGFTVEVHDRMPSVEYSAEDVVEAAYWPIGDAALVTWGGSGGSWPLELEPGVEYRVRYSAWNMDAGHQAGPPMDDEPLVDRYLLQFWPARPAPDRVVKETSKQAAYRHKFAREQPKPAQFAEMKQERARQAEEQRLAEHAAAWGGASPSERMQGAPYARELSALDRALVDALEQTDPQTLRAIARWAARRACEEAGYGGNEQIAGVLDRMDHGAGWLETLNGPPPPVEPGTEPVPTIALLGIQVHGWFDERDPFENTETVVTATFNEDPFHAAVESVWLATRPFVDKGRLPVELRERFLRNPGF